MKTPEMKRFAELRDEVRRLKSALGDIGALGDKCGDRDDAADDLVIRTCDPAEAGTATHVAVAASGAQVFLCAHCAELADFGTAQHVEIHEHEQDLAVQIALAALGEDA